MNVLTIFSRDKEPAAEAVDLAAVLTDLQRYGRPSLGMYGNSGGWHCCVELNTTAVGVRFDAKSDFKHVTPIEAAIVCRDRLRAALKAMGAGGHGEEQ